MSNRARCFAIVLALLAASPAPAPFRGRFKFVEYPAAPHDWPQFNYNEEHTGSNTREIGITPGNASTLQLLFQAKLPAVSDGPPVYWTADDTRRDRHVLFFTGTNGALFALRADGRLLWQTEPPNGPRWTTSSPALDPSRQFVYSYALDGRVHKYDILAGEEVQDGVWPELITRKPDVEKGSSALSIATAANGVSYLYVTIAGYPDPGDAGDYQGHVVAIRLDNGFATAFNVLCSQKTSILGRGDCGSRRGGVWGRSGVIYNRADDSIYIVTSNGPYNGGRAGTNWGDSILKLPPDLRVMRGKPLDAYTPTEYDFLDKADLDLGSSAIALLPRPGESGPAFGVHAGKDGVIRLIDLENLSGRHAAGLVGGEMQRMRLPQGGGMFAATAVWNDDENRTWVYFANAQGITAYEFIDDGSGPRLAERWRTVNSANSSPVIANGVLFCAESKRICALDARTGNELWSDTRIGDIHWQSPIVVNGAVYMSDLDGTVTAWALPKVLEPGR